MKNTADGYLTLKKQSLGFFKEKGSKFTAYAQPCHNEEEAKSIIAHLWKNNSSACHVCFAWRFGTNSKKYHDRFSDDGEPTNSAGKPIHGQIVSYKVTNVLIAVVRIYGGTNLGVGGLMNAYKSASKEALENAILVESFVTEKIEIQFSYSVMGRIMNLLKRSHVENMSNGFEGDLGKVTFTIRRSKTQNLIEELKSVHNTKIKKLTNN